MRRALSLFVLLAALLPAGTGAAPKDRGPAWASLTVEQQQALAARKPEREPAFALARASASGVVAGFGGVGGFSLRVLLPTLLLIAGLVAIYTWQQDRRAADIEELDAQLLTDDLPIDAYLDKGFEAWLKKVSSGNGADDR